MIFAPRLALNLRRWHRLRGHIEVGYVFDREVIFADTGTPAEFKPDDTFMVRGGVDF